MHWIDGLIVLAAVAVVGGAGFFAQRYVQGVSGFLAGGRVAGRYVLAVAGAEAGLGLVSFVARFEMQYKSGLAVGFWGNFITPVALLVTLTGFVVYRYRQTRAMTLAQFFEIRYSRAFRVFAGFLAFAAGLIHYALFPAVAGRFLIYFCGLPERVPLAGLELSTYGLVMALCLSFSLAVVLRGGQITAMVTDCMLGLFSYVAYGVLIVAVFSYFTLDQMGHAMLARPPGESFLNPFDIGKLSQFDLFYVIIGIVLSVYNRMSWQANQGFNCAAKSPHEQKMAGILGAWRFGFTYICITVLLLGAYTYLNHPDFLSGAAAVKAELINRIHFDNAAMTETIRNQMLVPVALRHILPVGVIGIFMALMVLHMLSTDISMMHSWGSIVIQDVVVPLRRQPLKPKTQMLLLRLSITGVAVFAWFFSYYFGQVTYIMMFFHLTAAIFIGGAGVVIIGGLYWRRPQAGAAWAAMLTGSGVSLLGFAGQQYWSSHLFPYLRDARPGVLATLQTAVESAGRLLHFVNWSVTAERFPFSGAELGFFAAIAASGIYVVTALLGPKRSFDLDRMLHRGKYDVKGEQVAGDRQSERQSRPGWRAVLIGIDHEYSRGDRLLAWSVFLWTLFNFAVFLGVLFCNLFIHRWSTPFWFQWWKYYTLPLDMAVGLVTTVWFSIGGTKDLIALFAALKKLKPEMLDDGRVIGHLNADDAVAEGVISQQEAEQGTATPAEIAAEDMIVPAVKNVRERFR